jgi:ribosomal protein S27AE
VPAIGRHPRLAPDGTPLHDERHRPGQTTPYRLVQQHAASVNARTEASTDAELPRFLEDECDAFLECGILAQGFLRLRCGKCGHDQPLGLSCKRRGFCPSSGARRMSRTAAHLVDHVIPHVPVRQWVLSLPIPLRVLLAAQPELVTPVLQVVQRGVMRQRFARLRGRSVNQRTPAAGPAEGRRSAWRVPSRAGYRA